MRDKILHTIKQNKPKSSVPIPEWKSEYASRNLTKVYKEKVEQISARCIEIDDWILLAKWVKDHYESSKIIVSPIEGLDQLNTIDLAAVKDPVELKTVELAILQGQLGVAENGAVWLEETEMVHRVLPFITQHLILVLRKENIVEDMHQAYHQINLDRIGFGVFIAGPSKTADIEQSLVIGAHGARSCTVVLM